MQAGNWQLAALLHGLCHLHMSVQAPLLVYAIPDCHGTSKPGIPPMF